MDLFLDGTWLQTLTNIPPVAGNILYATINGYSTNYPVPTNATIESVASGLADVLNQSAYAGQTKGASCGLRRPHCAAIHRHQHARRANPVSVSNSIGSASALATFVTASRTNFLDTVAYGFYGSDG